MSGRTVGECRRLDPVLTGAGEEGGLDGRDLPAGRHRARRGVLGLQQLQGQQHLLQLSLGGGLYSV